MNDELNSLARKLGVTGVFRGKKIHVDIQTCSTSSEAKRQFEAFGGKGWICTAGKVGAFPGTDTADADPILCAELFKAGTSLHIRQHNNGWIVSTLSESDDNDSFISEEQLLALDNSILTYRVSWELLDNAAGLMEYTPVSFRLSGSESSGGTNEK